MKTKYLIENDQMEEIDGVAWFVDRNENQLISMSLDTMQCNYEKMLPVTQAFPFRCNPRLCSWNQYLLLLPDKGKQLWVYDRDKKTLEEIELQQDKEQSLQIYHHWFYDNKAYLVSYGIKKLIIIDMKTRKVVKCLDFFEEAEALSLAFEQVGDRIYLASRVKNVVMEFDLESQQINYYEVPKINGGIGTICFDGKLFWLSGCEKKIYSWNKESNEVTVYDDLPLDFTVSDILNEKKPYNKNEVTPFPIFQKSILLKDKMLFIPWNIPQAYSSCLLCMNLLNNQVCTIHIADKEQNVMYSYEYEKQGEIIGILSSGNSFISEIDMDTLDVINRDMYITEQYIKERHSDEMRKLGYMKEIMCDDVINMVK